MVRLTGMDHHEEPVRGAIEEFRSWPGQNDPRQVRRSARASGVVRRVRGRGSTHIAAKTGRVGRRGRSGDRLEQLEVGGDVDRAGEAPGYRAEASVHAVHSLDVGAPVLRDGEAVIDPDPLDHEDAVLGLDLAGGLDLVALGIDVDVTRLQRAGERAGQSPTGRSDDVVERRGVRRIPLRIHSVVLGHLRVDPERDRALLGGQVGEPLGAAEPLDPDLRDVGDVSHRLAIISKPIQIRE